MQIRRNVLLLFNLDCPEALGPFSWLLGWSVVVAFVWVGFRAAKSKEREGEELEDF